MQVTCELPPGDQRHMLGSAFPVTITVNGVQSSTFWSTAVYSGTGGAPGGAAVALRADVASGLPQRDGIPYIRYIMGGQSTSYMSPATSTMSACQMAQQMRDRRIMMRPPPPAALGRARARPHLPPPPSLQAGM